MGVRTASQVALVTSAWLVVACADAPESASANNEHGASAVSPSQTGATAGTVRSSRTGAAARLNDPHREPCVVQTVTDGDSLRCRDGSRVRLLLIDAPEMSQEPFGTQSRDALRQRLRRGDTAWLEFDVQREDRYNRPLAHAWTAPSGGTHVNLAHARDGWAVAVVFPPNVRYIESFRAAVAEARREKRGLWADGRFTCEPIAHKQGRC